ncbi:hypothetical protein ACS0TY_035742 [Phlomoides rotata]
MEADGLHGVDQSPYHSKSHIMKFHKPYEVFGTPNSIGLLKPPPPSLGQLPPLLPLPASHLRRSSSALPHSPPPDKNSNGTRHHSFSLKKSSKIPRKEEKKIPKRSSVGDSDVMFHGTFLLPTISPPPSSLPVPTFALRPKPKGVDTGATDDLRRLLRLRSIN